MSFPSGSSHSASCEINVTPLIDVLLVLLIIFMVIVPESSRGLTVEAPAESTSAARSAPEQPVLVAIAPERPKSFAAEDAVYHVNGELVSQAALEGRVASLLSTRANRQVLVEADPGFAYAVVADAVDRGRAAGADAVGLLRPATPR